MRNRVDWPWMALALLGLMGGCCDESKRSVTIAGVVSYEAFQDGGTITLTLSEESSSRCSGSGGSTQSPGVQVASTTLQAPDAFVLQGNVCWTSSAPRLDLIARYTEQPSGLCLAQAWLQLDPADANGVSVVLAPGQCTYRK